MKPLSKFPQVPAGMVVSVSGGKSMSPGEAHPGVMVAGEGT